jgi:hypothetical protein
MIPLRETLSTFCLFLHKSVFSCSVSNFLGYTIYKIVRTSIVDATQDHCRTSPDRNTTRVPPATRHRSEHVDTPSTVGHGLAAPAPTARKTNTATSRHIAFSSPSRRPRPRTVALFNVAPPIAHDAPPSSTPATRPRSRFSTPVTLDAGPLARPPINARATKKHRQTRHGVLKKRGTHKKENPQAKKTKQGPTKRKRKSGREANPEFADGDPQYAARAATAAATPGEQMTGN